MKRRMLTFIVVTVCLPIAVLAGLSVAEGNKIYAEPVGSNVLSRVYGSIDVSMVVNNTEDRVGANAELCSVMTDSPCDEMTFLFPQLRLDKEKNLIYEGDTAIGQLKRWGMRVTLNKGYHLKFEKVEEKMDGGFDRTTAKALKVFLVQGK